MVEICNKYGKTRYTILKVVLHPLFVILMEAVLLQVDRHRQLHEEG